ncbi:MAG TPA: hypothetical protein VHX64_14350 [Caulobacteraceae bacterium]|nr:hypothetical protein [Caulobacteraceae bacterium]
MSKSLNIALLSAAACLTLGLAQAGAQQNGPPAPAAGAAANGKAAPAPAPRRGGGGFGYMQVPPQDEAKLRQEHPELYVLPPVSHKYAPGKTAWGDPDLRGMWPTDSFGGMWVQHPESMGDRFFLSDDEYKVVAASMEKQREAPAKETKSGKLGMGNWVEETGASRRTAMVVDPANGRLPELTPEGKRLQALGRSSWMNGQSFDWVTDFDSWDRCITRGFPASMFPFRYNNGLQVMQAPGYVVINLEMIHDARIIPLDGRPAMGGTTNWMGESRGHWDGNTLVIETDHIRSGASPLNMATLGAPYGNTIPMSSQAHVTERLTPTDANHITYEMTYSDPVYWTAPFTMRVEWTRNEKYKFYEYACHEGDVQVHNYVVANRFQRAKDKAAAEQKTAAASSAASPASAAVPVEPTKQ